MEENNRTYKTGTHRIGTFTAGVILVSTGVMYFISVFTDLIRPEFVAKLWPCIFILIGGEILYSQFAHKDNIRYDKAGVILTVLLVMFSMCMAVVYQGMQYMALHL